MFRKILILFVSVFVIYACSSSVEKLPTVIDNFDRSVMLTHITDNIIIPSYNDFADKMENLKTAGETFTTTPNQTNLDDLRSSWLTAYKEWQHVEMFDIGKAEELQFKFYMNVYPLTVADVEANISSGSYNLNNVNNHDAQGFAALDYLLYGVANTDAEILVKYTTNENSTNYKKYISDVLNQMNTLTTQVVSDFKAQRNTFIKGTQNTATSSVNKLINDYIFYYEKGLRANKLGIPAGIFSSTPLPEKVEAFYKNDVSKELALEALSAVKNLFEGKYKGEATANRSSFKQYLDALDRADIAENIIKQFDLAKAAIEKTNKSFSIQINTDNTAVLKSYDELQKAVVLLKVDMLQAFNVNIDYVDADGD